MKQLFFAIVILFTAILGLQPQISFSQNMGVNATGAVPNASAMLDVASSSKGLLIPRVALTATNSASPITPTPGVSETGLLVYNTATAGTTPNNVIPGYYYWNGTKWIALSGGSGGNDWSLTGNAGTTATAHFLGTTDNVSLRFGTNDTARVILDSVGRVGIGTMLPFTYHTNGSGGLEIAGNGNPELIFHRTTPGSESASNLFIDDNKTINWRIKNGANASVLAIAVNTSGNVGIGTNTPGSALEVAGQVKITGGSPGANKVLTSDANGLASWSTPTGGGSKFGGTGANGALSVSSGTTTLDLAGASVFVKNYTSIAITGTGALAFSNPNANGSVIILKSQGNVTITSSANPAIDLRSMGGAGGAGGSAGGGVKYSSGGGGGASIANNGNNGGAQSGANAQVGNVGGSGAQSVSPVGIITAGAASGTNMVGGAGGTGKTYTSIAVYSKIVPLGAGSGAAGGNGATSSVGGAGGAGAGGLYIEAGGNLSISSTINAAGIDGGGGACGSGGSGGGGGGGGGSIIILANGTISDTGTYIISGGSGGGGGCGNGSVSGGAGATGLSIVGANTEF